MWRDIAIILLQAFVLGGAGFIIFVLLKKIFKASDSE